MTGKDALVYMLNDDAIKAVRSPDKDCKLESDLVTAKGIHLTGVQLRIEGWQLAYQCQTCEGDGEIEVPCPRCHGRSIQSLLENPCCGGTDSETCPDCNGEGVVWCEEY